MKKTWQQIVKIVQNSEADFSTNVIVFLILSFWAISFYFIIHLF